MANIKLPERFENKLKTDQRLDGIVKTVLSSFGDIYEENKLFFFPEYTDHGIKHIQNVISSTDNLITDETFRDILKPNDIAYYILSVILHDLGMHINLDGFELLISGNFDDVQVKEFDNYTWRELWEDFVNEAKKFSGKQLQAIFGSDETIIRVPPFSNRGKINEDDKKLIGEFIRRNHPRLAHEISLKGFPGKPSILLFANEIEIGVRNMIGLIARSHGMGLRKCLDYLETTYGKYIRRTPNSTHATYLMILLRIADYIQIDSTRTFKTTLKLKTFSSSISENEHKTHLAIDDVDDKYQDDPERIFIHASPKDSLMFLKIKKLIKSIQYEFDISWAVLGELYGNIEAKPEIKYRRITSNLEEELFVTRQVYIADNFSFKANDEIIKLLIKPLYGNDPSYGVRELLQNGIDATKEREEIERKANNTYAPIVTIEIVKREQVSYFIIKDNGIGMDLDVIKNYFLSAGASFRKSIEWQKEFMDQNGNAIVRRSGRFGIGILAAFLIGREIYIETKKTGNKIGYKFSADLNVEQINIIKDESITEGTLIEIKIDEETLKYFDPANDKSKLKWFQWFTLNSPKTIISYLGKEIISYSKLNPDLNQELPLEWNGIDSAGFDKILWTYSNDYVNKDFTCNGVVIPESRNSLKDILPLRTANDPKISIFDSNAFTPLTLNRNSFSDKLSFSEELMKDIYKDFIAYFLVKTDISKIVENEIYLLRNRLNYPAFKSQYEFGNFLYGYNVYSETSHNNKDFLDTILISKKGFVLNYNYFIRKLKKIDAVFIQSEDQRITESSITLDIQDRFINFSTEKLNSINDYASAIDARQFNYETGQIDPYNSIIYIKKEKYAYLFNPSSKRMIVYLQNKCKIKYEANEWTCLYLDNPKEAILSKEFLNEYSTKINFIREYEITCPYPGYHVLDELLAKYIGEDVIIPYEVDERKKKFPLAFIDLERYMKKYILSPNFTTPVNTIISTT